MGQNSTTSDGRAGASVISQRLLGAEGSRAGSSAVQKMPTIMICDMRQQQRVTAALFPTTLDETTKLVKLNTRILYTELREFFHEQSTFVSISHKGRGTATCRILGQSLTGSII